MLPAIGERPVLCCCQHAALEQAPVMAFSRKKQGSLPCVTALSIFPGTRAAGFWIVPGAGALAVDYPSATRALSALHLDAAQAERTAAYQMSVSGGGSKVTFCLLPRPLPLLGII